MLSFVLRLPSGPQWKQCCSASNTPRLPDASESQKTRTLCATSLGPSPPHYTAWLQNMQTDRASLDSPVCVPASDASPQLQTKISQPCPQQLLRATAGLSVCKLCNWHIDICMCTQTKHLHCSLQEFTHTEKPSICPARSYEWKFIERRRPRMFDPVTHPGLHPREKEAV